MSKTVSMDGYIRVSQVGGREGESFITMKVQREKIEAWAKLHDVEIAQMWEETDQSGAKSDRPMFREALRRCKDGETNGIIVARLDRFSRSVLDTLHAVKELEECGARLVSVEDAIDGSTPTGRFTLTVLAGLGQMYWEQTKANWETAIGRAVSDGVHITGLVPTGYKKKVDKRGSTTRQGLVPVEPAASAVREAFRMRSRGESPAVIARFFEEQNVLPATGNPAWSRQGVAALLRNPVYLGQARGWKGMTNDEAHEPLVSKEEFEAAQSVSTVRHRHDGSIASQVLLVGILKCAGCGHNLTYTGTTNRDGSRTASYLCRKRYGTGICPAPAAARAEIVDGFVRQATALAMVEGLLDTSLDEVQRYARAQRDVETATRDLDALADAKLLKALGPERLATMAEPLKAALDEAKVVLRETPKPGEAAVPSSNLWVDWAGDDEPMERQRAFIRQFVGSVTLRRSGKRGRAAGPIADRLAITWVGQSEPDKTIAKRLAKLPDMTALAQPA